jgi:hypothetical protein
MNNTAEFDRFADNYDADLNQALSVSGENKDYFAALACNGCKNACVHLARSLFLRWTTVAGYGDTTALLHEYLGLNRIVGLDVSLRSVELAAQKHGSAQCNFQTFAQYRPAGTADLVYCNGVFHHIR